MPAEPMQPQGRQLLFVPVAQGLACDDGSPCTPNETCQAGVCQGQANTCQCQKDADRAAMDPKDLCKGKHFCQLKSNTCVLNPVRGCESSDSSL